MGGADPSSAVLRLGWCGHQATQLPMCGCRLTQTAVGENCGHVQPAVQAQAPTWVLQWVPFAHRITVLPCKGGFYSAAREHTKP